MNRKLYLGGLLAMLMVLSGCAGAVFVGATAGTGGAAYQERRDLGEYSGDNWVAWKIRYAFARSDEVSVGNINVSVYQGMVLLTGAAAHEAEKFAAHKIAASVAGVKEVRSEVKVMHVSAVDLAADSLISNQVKFYLFKNDDVRGLDIHVETTKGVVYLTGLAQSIKERNQAIEIARQINGVTEVVSYIEVDPDTKPVTPPPGEDLPPPPVTSAE